MGESTSNKVTCYSKGEAQMMGASQAMRGRWLVPLLNRMAAVGVSPNHLTLAALLAGLAFCPLFLWRPPAAFAFLVLHVLLDGLDGPLARHTGAASNRGSFADTLSDQIVVALTTLTLIYAGHIGIIPGGLYIFLYTMVVVFAMVRNALAIPYSWLVRPRYVVFVWMAIEVSLLPGTINYVLWACSILLAAKMLSGYIKIRKAI